jgi:hypothetical protein
LVNPEELELGVPELDHWLERGMRGILMILLRRGLLLREKERGKRGRGLIVVEYILGVLVLEMERERGIQSCDC